MSEENVEIVGEVFSAFERGDFWVPEYFDPNVRVVWLDVFGVQAETVGLEAMSDGMRDWLQAYDDLTLTAERIVDAGGDQVVVSAAWHGRGKTSGAPIEWRFGHLWTLHDGRVTGMVAYRELREALEAAGLSE
jgi:ketosteroid isomerase-like protein